MTSSCFSSAPMPGRPTTRSAYFVRLERPVSNSCSCARAIARPAAAPDVVVGSSRMSDPAMASVPLNRTSDALSQADLRRESDFGPRARDVERTALREEVDPAAIERRLDAKWRAERLAD